jgi:hypothetical protein
VTTAGPGPAPRARHHLPEAGLADLVRVAHALRPDPAVLSVAAELLGLARAERPAAPVARRAGPGPAVPEPGAPAGPPPDWAAEPTVPARSGQPVPVSAAYLAPVSEPPPEAPAESLADLLPQGDDPKRRAGLLPPGQARALLTHLGSRLRPDGDFDAVRAVDLLAHGRPLVDLPRLWIETTRGGTELVLDIGAGMQPFRSDLDQLPGQLSKVIGQQNLETCWFEDCPAGGPGVYLAGKLEPQRYRLPSAGTLIVAVTTFGVCGGLPAPSPVIRRWHGFVAAAARARTPVIALTPLRAERRPRDLPGELAVVTWDRTANVRGVSDASRSRGHGRPHPAGARQP